MIPTKPKQHAREIAWTIINAILDGDYEELKTIQLSQLVIIRDIIETEVEEYLSTTE